MFSEFIQAFALIFIAEMGDKTQILSMAFATKFKVRQILVGVALGAALNHGLAIAFGSLLNKYLPLDILQLFAGILFVVFALWSLNAEEAEDDEIKNAYGPIITVAIAFFLGELGDKTQLTALTLSAGAAFPLVILAGTVSGMVLTSLLGIFIGIKLGDKIKELYLKLGAYAIFMFFGLQKILTSSYTNAFSFLAWIVLFCVLAILSFYRIRNFRYKLRTIEKTAYFKNAEALRIFSSTLKEELNHLCKGLEHCNTCQGDACLVGYMKLILDRAKHGESFDKAKLKDIEKLIDKSFDKQKARGILKMLVEYYTDHETLFANSENDVFFIVREALEYIIFGGSLGSFGSFVEYKNALNQKDNTFTLKKL